MIGQQRPDSPPAAPGRFLGLAVAAGFLCAVLSACTYRGDIDNPATLKATWFSYLNGDDIRSACGEGAPLRYRLVYNADYDKQLRSYEVDEAGSGTAQLTARVQGRGGLVVNRQFDFRDPLKGFRWTKSQALLDSRALAALNEALAQSGAFAAAPVGLRLFSKETYWVSSLCKDGVFYFNAWLYPSERFEEIAFDQVLFGHDTTAVAVRPPEVVSAGARFHSDVPRRRQSRDERGSTFDLQVGENGFEGYTAL